MSEGRPRLRVNPIACQAHGLCIELLPELIGADPWGYPIIAPGPGAGPWASGAGGPDLLPHPGLASSGVRSAPAQSRHR